MSEIFNSHTVVGIDIGTINYTISKVTAINYHDPLDHGDDPNNQKVHKTKLEIGYWEKHNLLKGTEHTNATKVPITTLVELLIKLLISISPKILSTGHSVDGVCIESQIDNIMGINGYQKDPKSVMMALGITTYTFFKTLKQFGIENRPPKYVVFQNAKLKYKLVHIIPGINKTDIKEPSAFLIQRIKHMISNETKLKENLELFSNTGRTIEHYDIGNIFGDMRLLKREYKKMDKYQFNKSLGPMICNVILLKYDLDKERMWFNSIKKNDDHADALEIAIYELVSRGYIADYSTQEIKKTIKKPRKKRSKQENNNKVIDISSESPNTLKKTTKKRSNDTANNIDSNKKIKSEETVKLDFPSLDEFDLFEKYIDI